MGKYTKQHIYGEGIMDSVKSFFKKPTPKRKPPPPQPPKKVTFADKKAGDKTLVVHLSLQYNQVISMRGYPF